MILQSDFDIGFEIEGFALESNYKRIKKISEEYGLYFMTGDCSMREDENIKELAYTEYNGEEYCETIVPFEINTNPIQVTPLNILKVYQYFKNLYLEGIITNDTCALHAHVKLKRDLLHSHSAYRRSAMCVAYLVETKQYQNFQHFEGERMENTFWSSADNMMEEYKRIKENVEDMISVNQDQKRGLFHSHPIGTLEWRGPRRVFNNNPVAFLNKKVHQYELRLYRLVRFIFNIIPVLQNAYNGKNIKYNKDSLYWKLYNLMATNGI